MFDRFRGGNFMKSSVRHTGFYRPLMLCLTLVLFIAAAFSVSGFLSLAKEKEDAVSYKYFSSIMVRSGDTLTSIASRYADHHYESLDAYIEEVRATNNLTDIDEIQAGDYLIVPYYSEQFR